MHYQLQWQCVLQNIESTRYRVTSFNPVKLLVITGLSEIETRIMLINMQTFKQRDTLVKVNTAFNYG